MAINQKVIKMVNKLGKMGITTEKEIVAMDMDDILRIPGITIADMGIISGLQKSIKANKVIAFINGVEQHEL